ncbi:oxygenase MpaB family protein [Mucilaginibacter panaciglaebae]|uniref:ER-bound oxygenase mpaB/mpaB'/Rubber oxygenase catalytic domain-containing protein n=1 Tax=Mucilaginibacter panaciglaebae TaxID=502331 RepID=A0ABP7X074_9SPHI
MLVYTLGIILVGVTEMFSEKPIRKKKISYMEYFTSENSVVRKIWGSPDSVLFVFAGSAAEFALNKAVDWLYFTGRLPADPLGRLFSTVTYARKIIFSPLDKANHYIDQITAIHQSVEQNRGAQIPDWAYRDVLFMLIWYSIHAYEVLYRQLTIEEKEEVFDVFYRVGIRMHLKDLPQTYQQWHHAHQQHLENDTVCSQFTTDLYRQYRKHLGPIRFFLLKRVQSLLSPARIKQMLKLEGPGVVRPLLTVYKASRRLGIGNLLIESLLPLKYIAQVRQIRI